MKRIMKFWVPILLLLIVIGIAVLWRSRERFSSGAVEPTCPAGMTLVGTKCRTDAVALDENNQCPEGLTMNEEGACQRQAEPTCPPEHTLTVENGVAKCEPINRPAEPASSGQCPTGFVEDMRMGEGGPNARLRCKKETGEPKCPDGYTMTPFVKMGEGQYNGGTCDKGGESTVARCEGDAMLNVINDKQVCVEYEFVRLTAPGPNTTGGSSTTTGTNATGGSGVTPSNVRKNNVLGPVFTSYGAPVDGSPDSHKTNQYPELLGGGDAASRRRQGGGGFGIDLKGSMPTFDGLGSTEQSKFFPFSRQPGDMELIPDPYRVSQQFSSASYSFKTEPTPFLTDFSAFLR